jgi:hypothetical protein
MSARRNAVNKQTGARLSDIDVCSQLFVSLAAALHSFSSTRSR